MLLSGVRHDILLRTTKTGGPQERPCSRQVLHGHHVHPSPARDDRCSVRRGRQHVIGALYQ